MASQWRWRVNAFDGNDDGFTLIEAVVALVVLAIVTSAVAGLMMTSFKVTHDDKARVAASNLSAREVEITREAFAGSAAAVNALTDPANTITWNQDQLDGSHPINPPPLVVDGIPFTVERKITPQPAGSGHSACDGGSGAAHPSYLVSVTVTWPNMGLTRPVTSNTVLTPSKDFLDRTQSFGYFAVKVTKADGTAADDIPVQVAGTGGPYPTTTDIDGCAVVAIPQSALPTPPTTQIFTASISKSGYVDQYGRQQPTTSKGVSVGAIAVAPALTYDQSIELDASFAAPAGYQLPQTTPMLTLGNQGIQPFGTMQEPSNQNGPVTSIQGLWPFTDGYSVWAGSCSDADPAATPNSGARPTSVVTVPGGQSAVSVALGGVDVTVLNSSGQPVQAQLTATKPSGSTAGCSAADSTIVLGTTDATTGELKTSLPYGVWQINAVDLSGNAAASSSFSATSTAQTVEVDYS